MQKTRFLWLLVILLTVLSIRMVSYFYKNNRSKKHHQPLPITKDWLVVTMSPQPLYDFQFKYPRDYKRIKGERSLFVARNRRFRIVVKFIDNSAPYNPWIEEIKKAINNKDNSVVDTTIDKQKIGRYTAYLESRISDGDVFERNCFILFKKKLIWLTVDADTKTKGNEEPKIYEKVEDLANQILSTFQFND